MIFGIAPGHIYIIPFSVQLHQIPCVRPAFCHSGHNNTRNVQPIHQILHGAGISLAYRLLSNKDTDNILIIFRFQIIIHFLNKPSVNRTHLFIVCRIGKPFYIPLYLPVYFFLHRGTFRLRHTVIGRKRHYFCLSVPLILRIAKAFHPEQAAIIRLHTVKNIFQTSPIRCGKRYFLFLIHYGIQHLIVNLLLLVRQCFICIPAC